MDVIIIGGGPAGLCAGIYCARAGKRAVIFEKLAAGGQMTQTGEIENYPGYESIAGLELADKMRAQAAALGVDFRANEVKELKQSDGLWTAVTRRGEENAKAVILASGANRRKLGVPGEESFTGLGVSYCATCDGGFFKGRTVAVVGGGNTAFEDAIYLAGICEKVYFIHRREGFRAEQHLVDSAKNLSNIEFCLNRTVREIAGSGKVESITIDSTAGEDAAQLPVSAVFIAAGTIPDTSLISDFADIDNSGYAVCGEDCATRSAGLFVAGDARRKPLYQIVTAVADGAVAATAAVRYINEG